MGAKNAGALSDYPYPIAFAAIGAKHLIKRIACEHASEYRACGVRALLGPMAFPGSQEAVYNQYEDVPNEVLKPLPEAVSHEGREPPGSGLKIRVAIASLASAHGNIFGQVYNFLFLSPGKKPCGNCRYPPCLNVHPAAGTPCGGTNLNFPRLQF